MKYFTLAALLLASTAHAQGLRDSDVTFTPAELAARLEGRQIEFYDGSTAAYADDRSYVYLYEPGDRPWTGTWLTRDDSTVCVTFSSEITRCDMFVLSGERLTLITADGLRFPVRREIALP